MRESPHRAIFDRKPRRGSPSYAGAQIGTDYVPHMTGTGAPTQEAQTASGAGTHTAVPNPAIAGSVTSATILNGAQDVVKDGNYCHVASTLGDRVAAFTADRLVVVSL